MAAFEEPTLLWTGPVRTWQGRSERLQVEQSEYNGRPTVALRLATLNAENQWRWAPARQSSSGRAWAVLSLRRNELRELGEALIAQADALEDASPGGAAPVQQREQRTPRRPSPREQRALDTADGWPAPPRGDDEGLPF